jgi:hypothetical protein
MGSEQPSFCRQAGIFAFGDCCSFLHPPIQRKQAELATLNPRQMDCQSGLYCALDHLNYVEPRLHTGMFCMGTHLGVSCPSF